MKSGNIPPPNKLNFQKPADNLKLLDHIDELNRASK